MVISQNSKHTYIDTADLSSLICPYLVQFVHTSIDIADLSSLICPRMVNVIVDVPKCSSVTMEMFAITYTRNNYATCIFILMTTKRNECSKRMLRFNIYNPGT